MQIIIAILLFLILINLAGKNAEFKELVEDLIKQAIGQRKVSDLYNLRGMAQMQTDHVYIQRLTNAINQLNTTLNILSVQQPKRGSGKMSGKPKTKGKK